MEQIELGQVRRLIIANKYQLVRSSVPCRAQKAADYSKPKLIVNGDALSPEQELVQDPLSIVHVFSARLNGLARIGR